MIPTMVEYGERLHAAMKRAGVTTRWLANSLGVSYQAVKKVLDGKSGAFSAANNEQAAQALAVSARWLATGTGPMSEEQAPPQGDATKEGYEVVIPQYKTGGAMGNGLVLRDQPGVIRKWHVTREWVEKNIPYYTNLDNLAIVTGFGDSMLGLFNPGDPLLVDRGITRADVDGVYFFQVENEGFIKRLQRIPGEGMVVISENPKYRDWMIKPGMDFQVLAKVLRAWNGVNL